MQDLYGIEPALLNLDVAMSALDRSGTLLFGTEHSVHDSTRMDIVLSVGSQTPDFTGSVNAQHMPFIGQKGSTCFGCGMPAQIVCAILCCRPSSLCSLDGV